MRVEAFDLMEEQGESYWWYRARRDIVAALVRRFVRPGARLIDFGAGDGSTSAMLRNRGLDVIAADTSPRALERCRRRGLPTIDLTRDSLGVETADAVLAGDVLEHVEDDLGLVLTLRAALRRNGILLVTVPAYEFLWSGEDYVSRHVRRYRRGGLVRLLREAGFEILWSSYFSVFLLPAIAANILFLRILRPRRMYVSNIRPLPDALNELLYHIFAAERHLLDILTIPFGSSIVAVARKKV